jgi:hypothetical protein
MEEEEGTVYIRAMCETRSRPSPVGIANDF